MGPSSHLQRLHHELDQLGHQVEVDELVELSREVERKLQ